MKRSFIFLMILSFAVSSHATDFNDTDQMYGWNGSAQFFQTWLAHKAQLETELNFQTPLTNGNAVGDLMQWDGDSWEPVTFGELNASSTEVNYLVGVTSAVQTQLNGKQPLIGAGAIVSDDCSGETPTAGVICFEY